MKIFKILTILTITLLTSCGGKEKTKEPDYSMKSKKITRKNANQVVKKKSTATTIIDLTNKGIGPVKSVDISKPIDQAMVTKGAALFKAKCSACHRTTKKFIGPNPTGVLKRRSPEWVMNMIMNPGEMIKKDPIAKQLILQFNGLPMSNQNTSKEETRAILEYFRTLNS